MKPPTFPVMLLFCKSSCRSSVRPPSHTGIFPVIRQFATNNASSETSVEKQDGKGPGVNSLPPVYSPSESSLRFLSFPIDSGITPDR